MASRSPDFIQSASVVSDFMRRHDLEYARFQRLRSQRRVFATLNERRLRDWVRLDGRDLPARAPHRSTQTSMLELAKWIERDETSVLRALGVTPRFPSRESTTGEQGSPTSSAPERSGSANLATQALRQAGQGYPAAALLLLQAAFRRYARNQNEAAMELLPTLLYLAYRYGTPHEMAGIVEQLAEVLRTSRVHERSEPLHRQLSLAQLACALNERGQGTAAAQLFFCPEVRCLSDAPLLGIWPKTQLIRNLAAHWAIHGHRASEALSHVRDATQTDPANAANLRAGATICCQAIFTTRQTHCAKAWEAIEPYYEDSRKVILHAAEGRDLDLPDVLHLFSGLYYGALARSLSGKGYSSRADLQADVHALNWCQSTFGPIHIDDALIAIASRALPPALERVRQACLRPPLAEYQTQPFLDLQQLLLGLDGG